MKKIPTALKRNPEDRAHVLDVIEEGCEWVFAGEGVATRKYDGTCVMLDAGGNWWARREVKVGKQAPPGFQMVEFDAVTGKEFGWEPIGQSSFAKFHAEAIAATDVVFDPGTYELVGPKINGNPENLARHQLVKHSRAETLECPRSIEGVKAIVRGAGQRGWEGIVWHHPDGRMAKLKARDVGAGEGCPKCDGIFILDGRPMYCSACGTSLKHAAADA